MAKKKSIVKQMEEYIDNMTMSGLRHTEEWERRRREQEESEVKAYDLTVEELGQKKLQFGAMGLAQLEEIWAQEQHEGTKRLIEYYLQSMRERLKRHAQLQRDHEESLAKTYSLSVEEFRQKKVQLEAMTFEQLEREWSDEHVAGKKEMVEHFLERKYEEILAPLDYYALYALKKTELLAWKIRAVDRCLDRCDKPQWLNPGADGWRNS